MIAPALLLIDIQNDYFPGGAFALPNAEAAGAQAGKALQHFREKGMPVIHIQHIATHEGAFFFLPDTDGAAIHACVAPKEGEAVVIKHLPNSFLGTTLAETMQALGVHSLIICGMMSNMCVDATTRAAVDKGIPCTVLHDACAAADLSFGGTDVPAAQVHAAFMAALGFGYGEVLSCEEFCARN